MMVIRAIIFVLTCDRCFRKHRRVQYDPNFKRSKKIRISKWLWSLYYYFTLQDTIYYCLILSISVVGAFYNPAYFAFHLIELVRGVRLIKYVLSSVTGNLGQVIATLILAFIIIFWFTMTTFNVEDYRE
mmetsp:Transcript_22767/g.3742  ORF Transcript_22767/g.3742 Transcript_22767/m.3742 type:complete len:129 (+) Transcript_22767:829-1215(+)